MSNIGLKLEKYFSKYLQDISTLQFVSKEY